MPAATVVTGSILPNSRRIVSEWLSNRARQRRGRPKEWAEVIGVTHHAIHQRFKTNAAWTADDLARLMIADPDFERDFQQKLKELRACTSV